MPIPLPKKVTDLPLYPWSHMKKEYSRRSDGKYNVWALFKASWLDAELGYDLFESGQEHLDYDKWVVVDVVDKLPPRIKKIAKILKGKKNV